MLLLNSARMTGGPRWFHVTASEGCRIDLLADSKASQLRATAIHVPVTAGELAERAAGAGQRQNAPLPGRTAARVCIDDDAELHIGRCARTTRLPLHAANRHHTSPHALETLDSARI